MGTLYSANTLGSSVACLAAALLLMRLLGESGSVRLSACLNLLVGATALDPAAAQSSRAAADRHQRKPKAGNRAFRFWGVPGWAMGFVALGYEIVWYRIYSFATGGTAPCFAELLAFYLAGVAYGSVACAMPAERNWRMIFGHS